VSSGGKPRDAEAIQTSRSSGPLECRRRQFPFKDQGRHRVTPVLGGPGGVLGPDLPRMLLGRSERTHFTRIWHRSHTHYQVLSSDAP
jgi:hypothetical protein